jgi:hypothetical protein
MLAAIHRVWEWCVQHSGEIYLAAFFALVFELLRPASLIRAAFRRIKNKFAEKSVARLRQRITQLEKYRDTVALYLSSEKALYLHILGMILFVLLCMCGAGLVVLLYGFFGDEYGGRIVAFGLLAVGMIIGAYSLRLTALDTRPKVSTLVEQLNSEIAALKAKLDERRRS